MPSTELIPCEFLNKLSKFSTIFEDEIANLYNTTHCLDKLPCRGCKQIQIHTYSHWIIDFLRL